MTLQVLRAGILATPSGVKIRGWFFSGVKYGSFRRCVVIGFEGRAPTEKNRTNPTSVSQADARWSRESGLRMEAGWRRMGVIENEAFDFSGMP
jgi:hypothetical protein